MKTQIVFKPNTEFKRAKSLEEYFHKTIYDFFVPHNLSKPTHTLQFILNDFVLLGDGYIKDYILDSIFEMNRIVEFLTDLYDEFEPYTKGRTTDEIFPNSLTNTFFIVEDFYGAGKLSQPIKTLNEVMTHWLYEQSEYLDESRMAYLKEFNRISNFLILLKERFDYLTKMYSEYDIPQLSEERAERQDEVSQALSELWEEVEKYSFSEMKQEIKKDVKKVIKPVANRRSELMFDVMTKMNDCKDVCLQLEGVLIAEQDEAKKTYYREMYEWVKGKFETMRSDLASIFDLENTNPLTF